MSVAPPGCTGMQDRSVLCSATFRGGTERRDAKVGSLPHGCVYCRETSVYPPAENALGALERRCARPKSLSDSHLQDASFADYLPSLCGGKKLESVDEIWKSLQVKTTASS